MRYFNLASLRTLRPSVLSSRTVIPKRSLIQSRVWLQRSPPTSRSIMSAAPAEKREWLCIIPDKPGMLAKRLEIRPTHLANLKPLIEAKQIVTGGPMFNGAHPTEGKPADFKGSMMVLRGATEAEIREIISGDIYTKSDVWDLEKMQIIPLYKNGKADRIDSAL